MADIRENTDFDCPLTRREREILRLLARGLDQKQIAEQLYRSRRTIETHTQHIKDKLQARTLPHAVSIAWAKGWLCLRDLSCWLLIVGLLVQTDPSLSVRRPRPLRLTCRPISVRVRTI